MTNWEPLTFDPPVEHHNNARLAEICAAVDELKEAAFYEHNDPETLHLKEDNIRTDALTQIAECQDMREARRIAREALSTAEIQFPRWYS